MAKSNVLPFKRPQTSDEKWKNALVQFKGAPQLGTFKLIATPVDGTVKRVSVFMSQGPIPLSLLEWVGRDEEGLVYDA